MRRQGACLFRLIAKQWLCDIPENPWISNANPVAC